jgi:Serine aminopeptidase, S33
MTTLRARILFILLIALAPAIASPDDKPTWLLHLPGMGGEMVIDHLLTRGLLDGGIDADLTIYDWTGPDRGPVALAQVKRHEAQSTIVAQMIEKHVREHPNQKIIITSHSAGAGILAWALEKLPDDVMVDDIVFCAPALSPDFDLSKALRHARHKAYAFNSVLDVVVLGYGTKMAGTVDRKNVDAAGRVGFVMPDGGDAEQYAKLQQIPYDADWLRFGNAGEHIGPMMRPFARNVIASVLLGKGIPPHATTRPATQAATTHP